MEQIRIHGRGGQGVVTAAELIAIAAFYDGKQAQAFPSFGVERSGAPIQSFVRISDKPIITREQIYKPDILIIQDPTLLDSSNTNQIDIFSGINKETKIIINHPEKEKMNLNLKTKNIYTVPATDIALKVLGKNIVNTVILGSFAKHTGLISLASLKKAIEEKFAAQDSSIIEKNIVALEWAYSDKPIE